MAYARGDHFRFDSVFIKKKYARGDYLSLNRPVSVQFFRTKPVQTGLARFFQFGSILARFFPDFFGLGSVLFFRFQVYKTEPIDFFKILIGFFFTVWFFRFNRFFYSPLVYAPHIHFFLLIFSKQEKKYLGLQCHFAKYINLRIIYENLKILLP